MRNYDDDFVTDADREDGFVESDAMRAEKSRFDFSRSMGEKEKEAEFERSTDFVNENGGFEEEADGQMKISEKGQHEYMADESLEDGSPKSFGMLEPRFEGEVAKYKALEDMDAEELQELGLEQGTLAPIEDDMLP